MDPQKNCAPLDLQQCTPDNVARSSLLAVEPLQVSVREVEVEQRQRAVIVWLFAALLLAGSCGRSPERGLGDQEAPEVRDQRPGDLGPPDMGPEVVDDDGLQDQADTDSRYDTSSVMPDVVSVPVGPLALSGWVRIEEEEELPPGGIQVTARMGDQQFVTTTDAQGKYEIRDVMMSGVYKIQAGLPGYYAATHFLKVTQAVSYKVPDLTLRRWRILTDDPNPILGATMFNGSVVPYFTDLSPMGVYGKLWLYDVATDTSTLVDGSVSTDSGLLIEVPGSNLLLYTTNFQGTKSLLKVHGYRVDQR